MSELEMIDQFRRTAGGTAHEEMLRQRVSTVLSEGAQRVLDLSYQPQPRALGRRLSAGALLAAAAPDGSHVWQFGSPGGGR